MVYILFIVLAYGLIIGSFLNVCISRIPEGQSIAYPPSYCASCNNRIKPYDLIPVLSYMFLRGKCRYCGEKIPLRYTLIELFTGIIFLELYLNYELTIEFVQFAILTCFLIVIGLIDFDTTDIYDSTVITGLIFGFIFLGINIYLHLPTKTYLIGALIGGGFITLIILLFGGMGWGDAEFCALCGLFLGTKLMVLTLFLSIVIGGIIGMLLILTKNKGMKDYFAFGPYIALAALIALFFGDEIIFWYFSSFFF